MNKKKNQCNENSLKRAYDKPKIVSEEVFETLALACCKSAVCQKYGFPRGLHGVS